MAGVDKEVVIKKLEELMAKVPKQGDKVLEDVAKKAQQPKVHIFGGIVAVLAALVLYLTPQWMLFDIVAGVYPAYATVKMIATGCSSAEGQVWNIYWILYFLIRTISPVLDIFLSVLPFWGLAKLVGMVYLYQGCGTEPGAKIVLEKVLQPKVFPLLTGGASHEKPADEPKGK